MTIQIDQSVKGLIFDLDGTIADTMPIHYIAWKNAAARYGIDFTVDLFAQLAGVPLYATVEKLNEIFHKNIDPKEMGDAKEEEFEANMHKALPIEPVVEVIKAYHGKLPMSIGTGSLKRLAHKCLDLINLHQYFDIVITSEDVTNFKPHPETFLKCAELMHVDPKDCLVFEDGILGIQAAKTAGMKSIDVTKYYEVTIGK